MTRLKTDENLVPKQCRNCSESDRNWTEYCRPVPEDVPCGLVKAIRQAIAALGNLPFHISEQPDAIWAIRNQLSRETAPVDLGTPIQGIHCDVLEEARRLLEFCDGRRKEAEKEIIDCRYGYV